MEKLETLKTEELKGVLKWLKLYYDLTRKIWKRGKKIFNREVSWENNYKVEYFSSMNLDDVLKQSSSVFKKSFWVEPKKDEVVFIKNDDILWGIKVFQNDDMVDLSLSMAVNQIK